MRTIKRERATALIAVPRMIESLRTGIEREMAARGRADWLARTLKAAEGQKFLRRAWMFRRIHRRLGWKFWAFISGGAALATRDEEFFKRLGYAVVQGYGMTETASLISLNHPFRAAEGIYRESLAGPRISAGGRRRNSGAWRKCVRRIFGKRARFAERKQATGCTRAMSANWTPRAISVFAAARKMFWSRPRDSIFIPKTWKARCANNRPFEIA